MRLVRGLLWLCAVVSCTHAYTPDNRRESDKLLETVDARLERLSSNRRRSSSTQPLVPSVSLYFSVLVNFTGPSTRLPQTKAWPALYGTYIKAPPAYLESIDNGRNVAQGWSLASNDSYGTQDYPVLAGNASYLASSVTGTTLDLFYFAIANDFEVESEMGLQLFPEFGRRVQMQLYKAMYGDFNSIAFNTIVISNGTDDYKPPHPPPFPHPPHPPRDPRFMDSEDTSYFMKSNTVSLPSDKLFKNDDGTYDLLVIMWVSPNITLGQNFTLSGEPTLSGDASSWDAQPPSFIPSGRQHLPLAERERRRDGGGFNTAWGIDVTVDLTTSTSSATLFDGSVEYTYSEGGAPLTVSYSATRSTSGHVELSVWASDDDAHELKTYYTVYEEGVVSAMVFLNDLVVGSG